LFKDQDFSLDPNDVDFQHRAQRDLGSYTVTFFSLKTLFNNDIDGLFKKFENNRLIVSDRLGVDAGNTDPHTVDGPQYKFGYGKIQQEVLLPSFVAAYTEKDANTVGLDVFKINPSVNWKLNYNGLSKVGNLSKIFSSIQISHGYKSTLTVSSYNTDIFYDPAQPNTIDSLNFNYIARYEIPQVIINEQLAPLLGIDVKLRNDMTFRLDFKKSRTLAMSFIDYQLAETNSSGYLFGFGYRMRNVNIPFLTNNKTKKTSSKKKKTDTAPGPGGRPAGGAGAQQANDMNFKFDFELRDDITVNHRLDQLDEAVPTRGARTVSINPSIDYALNRRLTLRLFTDYRRTVPKTSQAFPITTVNAGVTVQFKLN
jgi:cell surface protein SprA